MRRIMMKSKIHRATVTGASVDYEGSITIDRDLMDAVDILPHEQVHVLDISNGARLVTYAIPGNPGEICVNGAAAVYSPTHPVWKVGGMGYTISYAINGLPAIGIRVPHRRDYAVFLQYIYEPLCAFQLRGDRHHLQGRPRIPDYLNEDALRRGHDKSLILRPGLFPVDERPLQPGAEHRAS